MADTDVFDANVLTIELDKDIEVVCSFVRNYYRSGHFYQLSCRFEGAGLFMHQLVD